MKAFLVLISLLLCSCSSRAPALQFNLGVETVELDWNKAIDVNSVVLLDNIMEGLTSYKDSLQGSRADLLRPMPGLAASWSVSEGGRVYRFRLKPNVLWTDGATLKAQHFVDGWQRLLSPVTKSANAYHLFDIENAQSYNEGRIKDFAQVGVKALDDLTLEVKLRRAAPYFLHLVASANTFPIRKDVIEKLGDQWVKPENLVTIGPYLIREWVQGEQIVLDRFPQYHGTAPAISTVICRLVAEPLTAYAMYENGELDILPRDLPPSYTKELQQHPDYRTGAKLSVSYLLFNPHRAPFDKVENRRAFIQSFRKSALANLFQGGQFPTNTWVPPGLIGHDANLGLRESEGAVAGASLSGKTIDFRYSGSDTWNLVFQSMQRTMEENLGLRARMQQLPWQEFSRFLSTLSGKAKVQAVPHVLHLIWVADFPDPHSFMNVFTSTSESNYTGWRNPDYDALIERAVATDDEAMRAQLYAAAQKILLEEDAVVMPLFFTSHQALVRSGLSGVQLNALDKWYFQNVKFEEENWRSLGRSIWQKMKRLRNSGSRAS